MTQTDLAKSIDGFWRWWGGAKDGLAKAIEERALDTWVEPISENVKAVHPDLAWELGPGVDSQHQLCVTGEGNPELRVVAERWLSRAPKPDAVWEYYPARQPSQQDRDLALKISGVEFGFDELSLQLETDELRRRLDVTAHHPKFSELSEDHRLTAVFLYLNEVLGEDGLERYIGSIEMSLEPLSADDEGISSQKDLRAAVSALADSEPEEAHFTMLQGQSPDGMPLLVMANLGLKRLDHLLMDTHVEVTIPYPANPETGLYEPGVGEELNALEDSLLEALGRDAVFIAHETGLGRRVIHLHIVPGGPAVARIEEWERENPAWDVEVTAKHDPYWEVLESW